ncbi:hypothetical protein EV13_0772 [Prochlorococcus sp. MIT 0702]|nr:hypothetical protein EV12_2225 [Prochlorococcus sp. MIT 0701]KGG29004.1 hypothetical protein EV12_0268 [Prochlorococcus sp. MIT 0701]KGG29968.1 hypothetical protein EV13_0772 [Prochlorococcus sp. MIT 0702]KGG36970.1 hypothetical protein EV14_0180 [Prochlorococcus sp. MIT 0703]
MSCVGLFSLDSYKISAFLVISTTQLWCRPQEVLVSFW